MENEKRYFHLFVEKKNVDVVASKGIFYWIAFEMRLVTIYLFDFEERWVSVGLPGDLFYLNDYDYNNSLQLKLGLVQGRPLLSELLKVDSHHLSLKVWDLKYNNGRHAQPSWLLVHEIVLEFEAADVVFVLGFC